MDDSTCNNEQRLKILEDYCRLRSQREEDVNISQKLFPRLLSDDKHQVLYCAITKTGCTSFKTMIANQTQRVQKNQDVRVQRASGLRSIGLKYLIEFSMREILLRLKSYTKIIVVRHPFDRLMSAYNDKFVVKNFSMKYQSAIGDILGHARRPKLGQRISFEDFIQLVVKGRENRKFINKHWATYTDLCHPCLVKYDHIFKLETFSTDSRTALSLFLNEGQNSISMPHIHVTDKRPVEEKLSSVTHRFKQFSEKLVQAVMAIYAADFKLFGYQWDQGKGATCNSKEGSGCC